MFNYSSDSLWLVTQILISPWWFFASISGFIFLIVRSVLTTAKKRTVSGGLDKFLRTTVLIAEIFAMLGVASIAGYVGKTILQSYLTQAQLEIERAPTKLQGLSNELFKAGNCWFKKSGEENLLYMGLTEVCALSRAASSPYRPDFDLNLLEMRIAAEATRQSYGRVFIVLTKLNLVIRKWQEEKSKAYLLELEQKAKAVELDFFYLVTALFAAVCSASLKISKAWAEKLYKK